MISLIMLFFAGVSNAIMDLSSENRFSKNYWNKSAGPGNDENKWKLDENGKRIKQNERKWYYAFRFTPQFKERFPYSSTFFVWTTDGWHLSQMIMINLFILSILFYNPISHQFLLEFVYFKLAFGLGFEPLYSLYKRKGEVLLFWKKVLYLREKFLKFVKAKFKKKRNGKASR